MSAEGIKPMASLGAALLGRNAGGKSAATRRIPLSFAPIEELNVATARVADVPEVVLQMARLEQALNGVAPADTPTGARVAFTLRLDPVRHGRLRQLALEQQRSAQQVLSEAFDCYFDRYGAGASGPATPFATVPSPRKAPTGNQP